MSEAVANIELLNSEADTGTCAAEPEESQTSAGPGKKAGWNPDEFAREQIRGLVRKVFLSGAERPVRQVVFSAVEPETDVRTVCRWVGEALAEETSASVAIAGRFTPVLHDARPSRESSERKGRLRPIATRVRGNLWLLPSTPREGGRMSAATLHQHLNEMRREFEFSVVEGRATSESMEAMAMAQFADGIILVLSAQHTRRPQARKIKEALEGSRARLMGTVLSDRVFPMPDAIYRRL